ncbi:MAG: PQQ-binding-like beta-propeller repeat protein [Deltaproteobacteria bacterium]|nr:PQQ-binding-like beta-propeller repeat protein [Deltaproteobacteria bacterium]
MLLIAGCSGSKSTTVVQQVVQGSSPVIQSLSVQGLPSARGGTITATVVAGSEQGLGLTYTWTTYNGWSVISGGSTPTATIQAPDTYGVSGTATVEVSDTNGRYALNTFPLSTAGDIAPVINSFNVSPNPAPKGGVTSLYVSATSSNGNSLYYTWQAADGWTIASGQGTSGITVTSPAQYGVSGTFTVTVYDSYGGTVNLSIPVGTVENSIPVISGMTASPNPAEKGGMMAIDVTATDPDGDSLSYVWQASQGWTIATGQGTSGITVTAPAQYGVSGTVTVTVDDGYGGTASLSVPVGTVGNSTPVISGMTASPNPAVEGGMMAIDVTATDPDGDSLSYVWQASQGWTIATGQGTSAITVTAPAQYGVSGTVTVTVDDGYGGTASLSVPVSTYNEFFPILSISPQPVITSTTITCNGYDPITDSLTYLWMIGGELIPAGNSIVWYSSGIPGYYTVSVTVEDGNGSFGFSSTSVSVDSTSPWPEFHRDLESTGQSAIDTSSTTNTLKWSFQTGNGVGSSPAIGADGTIYVGSLDDNLYAINPNGTLKWSYTTGNKILSSPAIGADGTIYVGSEDNNLYAINPNGGLKWSYTTGGYVDPSPVIGADGTIYVGSDDGNLYAITPTGGLKWSYTTGINSPINSPVIGADGTIYFGPDTYLYAITPTGGLKWSYTTGTYLQASPAIGADGTIYFGDSSGNLYAVNPAYGLTKWVYQTVGGIDYSPAIGADGTIYVGSENHTFYAINPDGTLKWSYAAIGNVPISSSPAIGADGTIYVGSVDTRLYAFNPNGTLKWNYAAGGAVASSPVIGADGTIYFGSGSPDDKLYAIH